MPDPNIEQIKLDLNRTFVDDLDFSDDNVIHEKMARILSSYTRRNPTIGYWQGMNCLAGMILRVVSDEEEAFWIFCNIIECILPLDYYTLMLQVMIDQKVLMHLVQTRKPKFLKNYWDIEVELVIKSFQWFICLFCLNFNKEVSQTVWDMMFLEGNIAIFKAAFILMELPEDRHTPEEFIKKYSKYSFITKELIETLRRRFRKSTVHEQREIYYPHLNNVVGMDDSDTLLFRRVKLLTSFYVLNKAFRDTRFSSLQSLSREELTFNTDIRCNRNNPLCLYDFTSRGKIIQSLVYRVNRPCKIYHSYFGVDDDPRINGGMKRVKSIFGIADNIEVTPEDDWTTFIRRLRKSTITCRSNWDAESYSYVEDSDPHGQDQLLMVRGMHLWAYSGFEEQFQKLFNEDSSILFNNPTIYYSFINEKASIELSESLVYEILSYKDFEQAIKRVRDVQLVVSGNMKSRARSKSPIRPTTSPEFDDDFVMEESWPKPRLLNHLPDFSKIKEPQNLGESRRKDLRGWLKFR